MHNESLETRTRAVIYAAKSTADAKGSIPTQVADCRVAAEGAGRAVVDEFADEGFSAYSGSRGPGLEDARRRVVELAAEHGTAELWVQHSDRLARGDAKSAAHLVEHFLWALKSDVTLRSVQDDQTFGDMLYAVVTGQRNHEDSKRKSASVRAGKRRRVIDRGEYAGGELPDGYTTAWRTVDGEPRRYLAIDPDRAPLIRRMFDLAGLGYSCGSIAKKLNAEGYRTRERVIKGGPRAGQKAGGRRWERQRVRSALRCVVYAGLLVHHPRDEVRQVVPGVHEPIVDRALFDRVQSILDAGTPAPGERPRGQRPTVRHLLAGLCRCGVCGSRMRAVTGRTQRKDGTWPRTYVCRRRRESDCSCPPVDAYKVEAPFIEHLHALTIDFDRWLAEMRGERSNEREGVERSLGRERDELAKLEGRISLVEADYLRQLEAGAQDAAGVASRALVGLTAKREQAAHRIAELETLLEATPLDPPIDSVLDQFNALREALRRHTTGANVGEVNARLREALNVVWLDPQGEGIVHVQAFMSAAFMRTVAVDPDEALAEFWVGGPPPVTLAELYDSDAPAGEPVDWPGGEPSVIGGSTPRCGPGAALARARCGWPHQTAPTRSLGWEACLPTSLRSQPTPPHPPSSRNG